MDDALSSPRARPTASRGSSRSSDSSGRGPRGFTPSFATDEADGDARSLRGMVEAVALTQKEAYPPPLTYASSSSSASFGSTLSSTSTSRTTSPAISAARVGPASPNAALSTAVPLDVAAAAHKLSNLSLPAPSLPLCAPESCGDATPTAQPEWSRRSGEAGERTRRSATYDDSSVEPSPLSTPPIMPRSAGLFGHSPAPSSPGSPSTVSSVSTATRSGSSPSDYDARGNLRPPNWGPIAPGAYRSSFPKPEHFPFLRSLRLKTILLLVLEPYPEVNRQFAAEEGIEVIQLGMPNNKDPLAQIPAATIRKALAVLLDVRKHPLLVHCNRGKHRTGCVVGCLRRLQRWSIDECLNEYTDYSAPKERASDQAFIKAFAMDEMWSELVLEHVPSWNIVPPTRLPDNCAPGRTATVSPVPRRIAHLALDGDDPCERESTPRASVDGDVHPFGTPKVR